MAQLFGSGPILNEALRAQRDSGRDATDVPADVWSVTSYNELRRDALARGALEPAASRPSRSGSRISLTRSTAQKGPIIASTDYMKIVPDQMRAWLPGRLVTLGTDGFGRSDNREHLRKHSSRFDAEAIVAAALSRAGARRQVRRRASRRGVR